MFITWAGLFCLCNVLYYISLNLLHTKKENLLPNLIKKSFNGNLSAIHLPAISQVNNDLWYWVRVSWRVGKSVTLPTDTVPHSFDPFLLFVNMNCGVELAVRFSQSLLGFTRHLFVVSLLGILWTGPSSIIIHILAGCIKSHRNQFEHDLYQTS